MAAPDRPVERVALVTGAARGIGAATVRRLLAGGCAVVAVDSCAGDDPPPGVGYALAGRRDLAGLEEVGGDRLVAVVGDVGDPEVTRRAVAVAVERWGRLDIAVAGAAVIAGGAPLWESGPEVLETLWRTDVAGVWHTAAAAVPAMLAGPDPSGCRFVAIASAAGERGLFRLAAYTTVKHAVVGLVRGLAADLVGTGVSAVAVSPGATRTAMLRATSDLYAVAPEVLAEGGLLQRLLDPDEVAATVVHCCSREAAGLTGSVVNVDGGFA